MTEKSQIETIFAEALQRPDTERPSFLAERCGDDADLRRQVESLLGANKAMGEFLEQTQSQVDGSSGSEFSHSSDSSIHGRFVPGDLVDRRYRIVSLVGRGGMGEVYRADDLKLGQTVALKFLPSDFSKDAKRLSYFHQEVKLTRQISHPNVCRVYDIGEVNGQHFLSMEYIDGEDLRTLLNRIGRLPGDKGVEIAQQMCAGLAAAHEKNVLHRDLKPANIMIDGQGQVRITDFGLAKIVDEGGEREVAGTPAYMAPEQLLVGDTSVQSDLYSLGLILAELFQGTPINKSGSVAELVSKHRSTDSSIESLSSVDLDPTVERVILACLQKNPTDRPSSARQLAKALPGGDPLEAAIAAGTMPSPELVLHAPLKERFPLPVAFGLLLIVSLGVGAVAMHGRKTKRMLETSPQLLSARCTEIAKSLGYTDLPSNTRYGASHNEQLNQNLAKASVDEVDELLEAAADYQFWQRWTDGVFVVQEFHAAFAATADGPIEHSEREVTVVVDDDGNLLRLRVVGLEDISKAAQQDPFDWSPVMDLAGFDSDEISVTELVSQPAIYCSQTIAWEVGKGEEKRIVQAGALGGKCNYLEVVGLQEAMNHRPEKGVVGQGIYAVVNLFVMLLAWMNVRASRADWKGAIGAATMMFGLYALQEALAIQLKSPDVFDALYGLLRDRAWGHMMAHAAFIGIVYLGIEPYVRRFWPRSLVGLSRILSLQWSDQRVGTELLVGCATGSLAILARSILFTAADLNSPELMIMVRAVGHPATWLAATVNAISGGVLGIFILASTCVVVRVITKRVKFEIAMLLIFAAITILLIVQRPEHIAWYLFPFRSCIALLFVLLFTRMGMLATYAALLVFSLHFNCLPMNFESWYAGYAIATMAIPVVLALYGFVTSQGGMYRLLNHLDPASQHV